MYKISGTAEAERICAKFTRKMCLVPRSDEFEGQGQRSKVKVTRDKNGIFAALSAACVWSAFGKTSLASDFVFFMVAGLGPKDHRPSPCIYP